MCTENPAGAVGPRVTSLIAAIVLVLAGALAALAPLNASATSANFNSEGVPAGIEQPRPGQPALEALKIETLSATPTTQLPHVFLPIVSRTTPNAITIYIIRPSAGDLVGDVAQVAVVIYSVYELRSVTAHIGARETDLVFSSSAYCDRFGCHPGWAGSISLVGLARGAQSLKVEAQDVFGGTAMADQAFVHDVAPLLTVSAPISDTIARPQIALQASCADDDPSGCVALTASVDGAVIVTGQSSIDTVVSLAAYDGLPESICFLAVDSAGQRVQTCRPVQVESSTKLTEIDSVGGTLWDVQPDRLLFLDGSGRLSIHIRASGEETTIPGVPDKQPQYGFLAPKGAIFVAEDDTSYLTRIYEWRDGGFVDLGTPDSATALTVKGNYAIWNSGTSLVLRDLLSGTNHLISADAGNIDNDVAANGDVVYWSVDYQVHRYRAGEDSQLTHDIALWNTYPLTDGINVVYRKHTPCCANQTYTIVLYGAGGDTTLASARWQEAIPGRDYLANNGWIAFTRVGTGDQLQVWRRSPAGEETHITFFGSSSYLAGLSPTGEVMFTHGNRRYMGQQSAFPVDISSTLGRALWQDGQWLVMIGRSLFRVES